MPHHLLWDDGWIRSGASKAGLASTAGKHQSQRGWAEMQQSLPCLCEGLETTQQLFQGLALEVSQLLLKLNGWWEMIYF